MNTLIPKRCVGRASSESGFSLVEFMVASAIGLFMLLGIIQAMVGIRTTTRFNDAIEYIQEGGRFVLSQMTKEVRMGGYAGCVPNLACDSGDTRCVNSLINTAGVDYTGTMFDLTVGIGGWDYAATSPGNTIDVSDLDPEDEPLDNWNDMDANPLHSSLQDLVVPGSDVLVVKYLSELSALTLSAAPGINDTLFSLTSASDVEDGTLVAISDCTGTNIFQNRSDSTESQLSRAFSTDSPSPGNVDPTANALTHSPTTTAEIHQFIVKIFYVGEGGSGEPTLYRTTYEGGTLSDPVEIVEGVESLQILFGIDTDSDGVPNQYVDPDGVGAGDVIISVRLSYLVRSLDAVRDDVDTNTYRLGGSSVATGVTVNPADDQRLRRIFSTTIQVRNTE
ncbi:MAG: PilW family protein [Magnetococcales bacterium]|nr:PilW family protein [Magnetococcales bacterium]